MSLVLCSLSVIRLDVDIVVFVVLGVLRVSWICRLVFIVNLEKFPAVFPSHISVLSPFCILIVCMYHFLLSQISLILCSLSLLHFSRSVLMDRYARSLFPQPCHQCFSVFVHISSLLTLRVCSYTLSAFPIRILSILITVTSDPSLRIAEFLLCLFRLFFLAF